MKASFTSYFSRKQPPIWLQKEPVRPLARFWFAYAPVLSPYPNIYYQTVAKVAVLGKARGNHAAGECSVSVLIMFECRLRQIISHCWEIRSRKNDLKPVRTLVGTLEGGKCRA